MVPRLSIVIPARTGAEPLERSLLSILENRPRDSEVLVVNACRYQDPYQLADEVRFIPSPAKAGLVDCLNLGLESSTGEIVHFLEAGVHAQQGWTDAAMAHFQHGRAASVAPALVDEDAPDSILSAGLEYRATGRSARRGAGKTLSGPLAEASPVLGGPWSAVFLRRQVVKRVGGFDPAMGDEFADLELAFRLRKAGWTSVYEPNSRLSAPKSLFDAPKRSWWQQITHGRRSEKFFQRGALVNNLPLGLVCHGFSVLGETLGSLGRGRLPWGLLGRTWANFELGGLASYNHRLNALAPVEGAVNEARPRLRPHHTSGRAQGSQALESNTVGAAWDESDEG